VTVGAAVDILSGAAEPDDEQRASLYLETSAGPGRGEWGIVAGQILDFTPGRA